MRDLRLLTDNSGAIFTAEAVLASLLLISAVACLELTQPVPASDAEDLGVLAGDLLSILEHRDNSQLHPGLAAALSSPEAWEGQSGTLEADIRSMMPAGVRCYMTTPYGTRGDCPPESAEMAVRPFQAYSRDSGSIIECSLILWRG